MCNRFSFVLDKKTYNKIIIKHSYSIFVILYKLIS